MADATKKMSIPQIRAEVSIHSRQKSNRLSIIERLASKDRLSQHEKDEIIACVSDIRARETRNDYLIQEESKRVRSGKRGEGGGSFTAAEKAKVRAILVQHPEWSNEDIGYEASGRTGMSGRVSDVKNGVRGKGVRV